MTHPQRNGFWAFRHEISPVKLFGVGERHRPRFFAPTMGVPTSGIGHVRLAKGG